MIKTSIGFLRKNFTCVVCRLTFNYNKVMPMFRYVAITREGKKITGQITADSEEKARKELHRIGFSVLTINVAEEGKGVATEGMKMFEFEGYDEEGKAVKGTIEGSDSLPVYRRLIEEYKFKVNYLCEKDAPAEEKAKMRGEGLKELETLYLSRQESTEEKQGFFAKIKKALLGVSKLAREDSAQQTEKEKKRRELFLEQIDTAIKKAKSFLEEYGGKMSADEQKEIKINSDELQGIRNSKNEKNIKKVADDLLEKIKNKKEELNIALEEGEGKIDMDKIDALSDEEAKKSDENMQDYLTRLEQMYETYSLESLWPSIRRDAKRLIFSKKKKETWKRLLLKIKIFRKKKHLERLQKQKKSSVSGVPSGTFGWIFKEVHGFVGVLLFFYIFYFLIAGMLVSKNFGFDPLFFQKTLQSVFLKQILLFCFLFYSMGVFYNIYIASKTLIVRISYWVVGLIAFIFLVVNI